jgi:hypothetical protein
MKTRYRLIHRGRGHGTFYCVDSKTGKRTSLAKANKEEARQIVDAKNQAERQPMLNLQLAKAYLAGTDAEMSKRTWQRALEVITDTKRGVNKERWKRVAKDRALSLLWPKGIVETEPELVLKVLRIGRVHERLSAAPLQLLRGYELAAVAHCSEETMAPLSGFRRRGPSPWRSIVGSSSGKRTPSARHSISWPGIWEPPSRISLTFKQRTSTGRIA